MANILLAGRDQFAVLDWETGCRENWPLLDFFYAVTDAVRITAGCTSWLEAFQACYRPQGSYAARVKAWQARLQTSLGLPPGIAELCFHACWLHHAFNEYQVNQPGEPRPFLEIVQWLAADESIFNHN
jgi:hypothetical protein